MNIITLDFESFFGDDYTLKKMSTEAYIRDPRFEIHGCGIRLPDGRLGWLGREQFAAWTKTIDWANTVVLCHHAAFDGLILSHHYGVKPKALICTMSMARLLIGNHVSASLDSLSKHFELAAKNVPYNLFRGKHWHELDAYAQQQVAAGCLHDVSLTWDIFNKLAPQFPREEWQVMNITIQMFTDPVLRADTEILGQLWLSERDRKQNLLQQLNVTEAQLQSADQFCQLLKNEGVEIAYKQGKNGEIPALAKNDQFMRDLLEDENERVRTLAETRLGVKSTILQTRAETLGNMATRGPACVYLNYCGAGTLRPTGGDKTNWLNFKRGSLIRKSILAPEGYVIAPVDSSQIECRVLHYLAGGAEEPVIRKFKNGDDPYVDLASRFYGETIYKPKNDDPRKAEMEAKRGMGKQGRLMCGYGAAGDKFRLTAKAGLYGPSVDIPTEDANRFVAMYREDNPSICHRQSGLWAHCEHLLRVLCNGATLSIGHGGVVTAHMYKLWFPNGTMLNYDSLEWHVPAVDEDCRDFERGGYFRMRTRQGWKKMWGSKLVQNICEAVSRLIVSQAMLRIAAMGFRTLNWPYDELLLLLPKDGHEDKNLERCMAEMRRPVAWLPGLPLDCDGAWGERYSK